MNDIEHADRSAAIAAVLARLAHATDRGSLDEYSALLADDVVVEIPDVAAAGVAASVRRGRAQVLEGVAERRRAGVQGPGSSTLHVVSTIALAAGEHDVDSTASFQFFARVDGAPALRACGVYRDRFVRQDGQWVLSHRVIEGL